MRLLLDTHILLWWLADDPALPERADALIADQANEVFASAISLWEIAIKARLGKIAADAAQIHTATQASGLASLAFTAEHALAVAQLPNHHRDPFDRALVAQARVEPLHLITHDAIIAAYGEHVLFV
jgi:PIN domain nuclease of toxin-antitoxin system